MGRTYYHALLPSTGLVGLSQTGRLAGLQEQSELLMLDSCPLYGRHAPLAICFSMEGPLSFLSKTQLMVIFRNLI